MDGGWRTVLRINNNRNILLIEFVTPVAPKTCEEPGILHEGSILLRISFLLRVLGLFLGRRGLRWRAEGRIVAMDRRDEKEMGNFRKKLLVDMRSLEAGRCQGGV